MSYIKLTNYRSQLDALEPEQQIRINHSDCGDERARLYIKRVSGYGYVAYCHNCSGKGYVTLAKTYSSKGRKSAPGSITKDRVEFPTGLEPVGTVDGRLGASWLYPKLARGKVKALETAQAHVDLATRDIYLPVINNAVVTGYNRRAFHVSKHIPKWSLNVGTEFAGYQIYAHQELDSQDEQVVVFTEDQLSAASIADAHSNYIGVCLFGTKSSIENLHAACQRFTKPARYVVWFDNDSALVRRTARRALDYLKLITSAQDTCGIVLSWADPKGVDDSDIRKVIDNG